MPKPGDKIQWFLVLSPLDALRAEARHLLADEMVTHFATYVDPTGRPGKNTRYQQGRLQGRLEATLEAIALIEDGHNYSHGDRGRQVRESLLEALIATQVIVPDGSGWAYGPGADERDWYRQHTPEVGDTPLTAGQA